MQLFIQNFRIQQNNIHLDDKDCIKQMRTVLRMKTGDTICIQTPQPENNIYTRHTVTITQLTNDTLIGAIQSTQEHQYRPSKLHMRIAMPNKAAKGELIVQKLSEIGIEHIHFRPAERSVVKTENANKMQRLRLIASEAVEQSWGWTIPTITIHENMTDTKKNILKIFFDMNIDTLTAYIKEKIQTYDDVIAVIGPEGGLTTKDYAFFGSQGEIVTCNLGDTVLRMETAAIIAGWQMKKILEL